MASLIDSSVWVHYFRPKTPRALKAQAASFIDQTDALLCEPVRFEILRGAASDAVSTVNLTFANFLMLPTPMNLWEAATDLGVRCNKRGIQVAALDILIAQIAIENGLLLVTYDRDFLQIQNASELRLQLLTPPAK